MTMGCHELRSELHQLTIAPEDVIGRERIDRWLGEQIQAVAALNDRYPHSIILYERSSAITDEMNCFMYALGIGTEMVRDMCYGNTIFPGATFVSSIIGTVLKPKYIKTGEVTEGDIVIYFDDAQKPLHAGLSKGGRIISKWGSGITHVWGHEVFEVPSNYGEIITFYGPISPQQAVNAFREWASVQ
jgi:hypothetical protein